MTGEGAPSLSVVVPSVNGWQDLEGCLRALEQECATVPLEVVVPERCGASVQGRCAERFPWAIVLPVSADTTIPQMRSLAFDRATAPTVAVIEDHVLVPPGWAQEMVSARSDGVRVVGGTLVNAATERTVDWAAFLCEYSHVLTQLTPGPADWLVGNNTSYERTLLDEFRGTVRTGRWENVLHDAMKQRGVVLWCAPDIVVLHKKHYTVGEYTSQRFLYARAFAADRMDGYQGIPGVVRRVLYGAAAGALPPVLYARIVSRVWKSGLHRRELLRSLPLLMLFVVAWGVGEMAGAWFGGGGALAKVK